MHIIIKFLRAIDKINSNKQNSYRFFNNNKMSSYNQRNYQQQATLSNTIRRWNNVTNYQNNKDLDFILGSYNILADQLYRMHNYLYCDHDQNALHWTYRFNRIMIEVLSAKPQVLCLQEVQHDHLEQIVRGLKSLNFDYLYKKRTGTKPDGCAVLYNRNLFNLVEFHNVEFEQPGIHLLDRENVAILAKLSLKSNPSMEFVVATTHLLYNPKRQDIRLVQIQILLAELDRISKTQDIEANVPVILTGDFNLQPHTAPYNLLTKGNLHYANLQQRTLNVNNSNKLPNGRKLLPIELGITDSCQHLNIVEKNISQETKLYHSEKCNLSGFENREDVKLTKDIVELFQTGVLKHDFNFKTVYDPPEKFASTHQDDWVLVDYIFFSATQSKKTTAELKLLSYLKLPSPVECTQIGMIPNIYLGSDHLSLFAKFRLEPNKNVSTMSSSNLTGRLKGQL